MVRAAICFATQDAAFASELSSYLSLHVSICIELAECRQPADFLDAIEQCLTCEIVIVVLSAAAVPRLWPRTDWERVFVGCVNESGSHLAYFSHEVCPFPQVLTRRSFFDSLHSLRQWAIHCLRPERESPKVAMGEENRSLLPLLEEPGLMIGVERNGAEWFISSYWRLFENVYRVERGSSTRAGILGEVAQAMGLRLAGTVQQNWEALQKHAQTERALYVFEHVAEEFGELAQLGGKASVMVLADEHEPSTVRLEDLKAAYFAPGADEAMCLRLLGRFMDSGGHFENWDDVKAIGFRARLFFQKQLRLAEAHELLVWLAAHAQRNGDTRALEQIQREENWVLDSWDLPPVERTDLIRTQPSQLDLSFI